ncbi:MAG: PDR/VanB family oxidoreductase [Pseudomonadota bacterium]
MTLTLRVAGIHDETDRIRVFELECPARPAHEAGAHIDVALAPGSRSYSLIDWPGQTGWRIAVQCEDAGQGGSQAMHALALGDALTALGPKNDFPLAEHAGPALLLAGGIGITPLISHATALQAAGRPFAIHYTTRSRSAAAFIDPLQAAFGAALTLHHDDETPLDLPALMGVQSPDTHLYLCGPRGMIDAARAAFIAAGLPESQLHIELFETTQPQEGDQPFEVEVADTGDVFTIPPGKTIIEVLEAAGHDLIYDCQRGDCGICQTDVIAGEPDHRDVVLSEAERASGKLIQICVSRAKSARLVLDL